MSPLHIIEHDVYVRLLQWYMTDYDAPPVLTFCGAKATNHFGVHPLGDVVQLYLFKDLICEKCFNHPDVQLKLLGEVG